MEEACSEWSRKEKKVKKSWREMRNVLTSMGIFSVILDEKEKKKKARIKEIRISRKKRSCFIIMIGNEIS
jgi:hypothetical protein